MCFYNFLLHGQVQASRNTRLVNKSLEYATACSGPELMHILLATPSVGTAYSLRNPSQSSECTNTPASRFPGTTSPKSAHRIVNTIKIITAPLRNHYASNMFNTSGGVQTICWQGIANSSHSLMDKLISYEGFCNSQRHVFICHDVFLCSWSK